MSSTLSTYQKQRLAPMSPKTNLFLALLLMLSIMPNSALAVSSETKSPVAVEQGVAMASGYVDGEEFISKMCAAADALNDYSSNYQMTVYKQKPPVNETGMFAFRKPRLMRVEVFTGPNKGSVAVLEKDGKVHGHLGGALKFFSSAVSPNSSFARAANGFPMVGTDFFSLADYLRNMLKQSDVSRLSKEPIQTKKTSSPTYVLEMCSGDSLVKRIYVDPTTLLPVYWEDYTNGKLWSESSWSDLKKNVDFSEKYFKF